MSILNNITLEGYLVSFIVTYSMTLIYHILFVKVYRVDEFGYRIKLSKFKKIMLTIKISLIYGLLGSLASYIVMLWIYK